MSYEPTNWKDGDLVTSAKLNKLEQGVANGGGTLIVNLSAGEPASSTKAIGKPAITCDKTAGEIYEAFRNGNVKFISKVEDVYESIIDLIMCQKTPDGYSISVGPNLMLYAVTADDYPTNEVPVPEDETSEDGGWK